MSLLTKENLQQHQEFMDAIEACEDFELLKQTERAHYNVWYFRLIKDIPANWKHQMIQDRRTELQNLRDSLEAVVKTKEYFLQDAWIASVKDAVYAVQMDASKKVDAMLPHLEAIYKLCDEMATDQKNLFDKSRKVKQYDRGHNPLQDYQVPWAVLKNSGQASKPEINAAVMRAVVAKYSRKRQPQHELKLADLMVLETIVMSGE